MTEYDIAVCTIEVLGQLNPFVQFCVRLGVLQKACESVPPRPHGSRRRSCPSMSRMSNAYRNASLEPLRPTAARSLAKSDMPSGPQTTPSPSMVIVVTLSASTASTIRGTLSVQSFPRRENTRTRSSSRRAMNR